MNQVEEQHQKAVVTYLTTLERQGKIITFFSPINENKHSKQNRALALRLESKAKAMGKKAGVSDLVIIYKDKVLFLEMKQPMKKLKNGTMSNSHSKPTDKQKDFLLTVLSSDVCFSEVGYGFADAKIKIDKYIKLGVK